MTFTKVKRVICIVLSLIMALGLFTGCGSKNSPDSSNGTDNGAEPTGFSSTDKVRLSVVGPMTGPQSEYGIGFARAGEMIQEKWNAKGGCAGMEVEIIAYDDQASVEEDLVIAQKITADPLNYGVVGHFAGPMVVPPLYDEAKMVYIAPAASAVEFSGIGEFSFRNNYTLNLDARWLTDIAVSMGYTETAIVYVQNDWGASALATMQKEINSRDDFSIIAEEAVQDGTVDFSVLIAKLKNIGCNCVVIQAMYPIIAPFAVQVKEVIPDIQIFAPGSIYNNEFLNLAGESAEGMICTTAFASESTEEVAVAFSSEYHKRYGSYPSGQTAQCYDSLDILLTAIDALDGVNDGAAIKEQIEGISFDGVCGHTTFDELHDAHKPRWVVQVKEGGGAWKVLGSVE